MVKITSTKNTVKTEKFISIKNVNETANKVSTKNGTEIKKDLIVSKSVSNNTINPNIGKKTTHKDNFKYKYIKNN